MELAINNVESNNIVEKFLKPYQKSKHTRRSLDCTLRLFFNVENICNITIWMIKKVKYENLEQWILKRFEDGKSDNTIKKDVAHLKTFFEYCEDENIIKENPINNKKIKKLLKLNLRKDQNSEGIALSEEEVSKLLSVVKNKRHKLILNLMFQSGLRISGILSLKPENIIYNDIKKGWFLEVIEKGNKKRFVPIKLELVNMLKEYIYENKIKENEKIFTISNWAVNKFLKKYCELSGVQEISCHSTRRTAITGLIKEGRTLPEVAAFAGHNSWSTTKIYFKDYEKFNNEILDSIKFEIK